jgi:hypothetical protein
MSIKKYGPRLDERQVGRKNLFNQLQPLLYRGAQIKSDASPHYFADVKRYFPDSLHVTYLGQRGAITGQGELKKVKFDPLFSLNHTYAMCRANICSLIRKTWCTTKKPERLLDRILIYAEFHNFNLIAS